jgi:hypothetical protein
MGSRKTRKIISEISNYSGKSSLKYLTIQENPTRNTHIIMENNKIEP